MAVLEFSRDRAKAMPSIDNPASLRAMRIWHCNYVTLSPLSACVNLQGLEVATFPDDTLEALSGLGSLKHLRIMHLPHVSTLEPLRCFASLVSLSLETLPSWDSSGKVTVVDSLQPIAQLPSLKHLTLMGIRTADKTLESLLECAELQTAWFHKFPKTEVARFFGTSGVCEERNPSVEIEGLRIG